MTKKTTSPSRPRKRRRPPVGPDPSTPAAPRPSLERAAPGPEAPTPSDGVVVGVGASAGGLEAFKQFLEAMPTDTGLAFVLIQHLDPDHESLMADLLSKYTAMSVVQAEDNSPIRPNHVYTIPPNTFLTIRDDRLFLEAPVTPRGMRLPIDHFLHALAAERQERAVGIVLSGTGSDGSQGLRDIKAAGGLTLVQAPDTADYDGMPRSAVATDTIDFVLPIDTMPRVLAGYGTHPYLARGADETSTLLDASSDHYRAIMHLLRAHTDYDFRCYKNGTLSRRIQRRMGLRQVPSLAEYVTLLRQDADEVTRLFKDLLISVTSFFREPEAWAALDETALATIVSAKPSDRPVRVWVPGCATGEEAYTLAMLLIEQFDRQRRDVGLQIFATDLDAEAIEFARQGIYPEGSLGELPPARRQRFFEQDENARYRVRKRLRDVTVFAVQNLIGDPPFSNLDLISCRNVMIYLEPDIQRKMLQLFHFALRDAGYLFLGTSETVGKTTVALKPVSSQHRLYQKVRRSPRGRITFPIVGDRDGTGPPGRADAPPDPMTDALPGASEEVAKQLLLERFAPATVLMTPRYDAQYFQGPVGDYLRVGAGEPTTDVTAMCLEGLRSKLRAAVHETIQSGDPQDVVAPRVKRHGTSVRVKIHVEPLPRRLGQDPLLLVTFEDDTEGPRRSPGSAAAPPPSATAPRPDADGTDASATPPPEVQQLECELQATREDLQSTIEELETSNEELKASNEEVMSMNEELQSANEELETSREELQSLNEELSTVNAQLEEKIGELESTNNDLANLLTSTEMATIFLDAAFCIRRFTPSTATVLHLIDTDIGRPISDLALRFNDPHLYRDARSVLRRLTPIEREVGVDAPPEEEADADADEPAPDGFTAARPARRWLMRRILPYRTDDQRIDGIVVTFTDVTRLKAATRRVEQRAQQTAVLATLGQLALAGQPLSTVFERTVQEMAATLDMELCTVLEHQPTEGTLRLVAGVGWKTGLVGTATVDAGTDSQAGYTLHAPGPVMVPDLDAEQRFQGPPLLHDHGVKSGMSVVIGPPDRPWGILGAYSRQRREYTVEDTRFLQAIAGLLWETLDRRRQARAVRDRERRLQLVTDALPVLIAYCDRDHIFRFANAGYRDWFNLDATEIIGTPLVDVIGHQAYDIVAPLIDRVLVQGESVSADRRLVFRHGPPREVHVQYVPHRTEDGAVLGYFEMIEDITDRVRAEDVSRHLAALVAYSNDAILGKDRNGIVTSWNAGAQRLYGYTAEEMIGQPLTRIAPPDRAHEIADLIQRVVGGETVVDYETERVCKDGSRVLVSLTVSPVKDHRGQLVGLSTIARDITQERRHAEMLETADRRKDEFLATLAHELRNPLLPLRMGLDVLREATDPETANTTFGALERQLRYLTRLVDDLLDVSRIATGRLTLRTQRVDLVEVLHEAIESTRPLIEGADLTLEVRLPEARLWVEADPHRVMQVCTNLLSNAGKYTPAGGTVTLAAERRGDDVWISVRDTGIGIPPAQHARIFEMFSDTDDRDDGQPKGLGVGLTLARTIAELHGGRLEVESAGTGQGACFSLVVPVGSPREPDVPTAETQTPPSTRPRRVLVVDDSRDAREMLRLAVEHLGHEVVTAGDGQQAVTRAKTFQPDVVLMDVGMPTMDGLTAARQMREQPGGAAMVLVALTGWGTTSDKQQTREAGFDAHLTKPVSATTLARVFADLDDGRSSR